MSEMLKDIEFMFSTDQKTKDAVLTLYQELEESCDSQAWIESFVACQAILKDQFTLIQDISGNTPHKKCFSKIVNSTMTQNNAESIRTELLELKKEFENFEESNNSQTI